MGTSGVCLRRQAREPGYDHQQRTHDGHHRAGKKQVEAGIKDIRLPKRHRSWLPGARERQRQYQPDQGHTERDETDDAAANSREVTCGEYAEHREGSDDKPGIGATDDVHRDLIRRAVAEDYSVGGKTAGGQANGNHHH